jgi:hypothetical protein
MEVLYDSAGLTIQKASYLPDNSPRIDFMDEFEIDA